MFVETGPSFSLKIRKLFLQSQHTGLGEPWGSLPLFPAPMSTSAAPAAPNDVVLSNLGDGVAHRGSQAIATRLRAWGRQAYWLPSYLARWWLLTLSAAVLTACAVAFPVLKYATAVEPFVSWPAAAVFAPLIFAACSLAAALCALGCFVACFRWNDF